MTQVVSAPTFEGCQPYRMAADEYIRAILAGGFGNAHVELVEGELVEMAPAKLEHSKTNGSVAVDLGIACRPFGYRLLIDAIVHLTDSTVRAPDIAVTDVDSGDRQHLVPTDILLAVEIAQSTLTEDIGRKRIDYASSGIRNYWVVDVDGRRVHCYAEPQGSDYATIRVIPFGKPLPVPGTDATITIG
jgi:Uma2 family endonuclease